MVLFNESELLSQDTVTDTIRTGLVARNTANAPFVPIKLSDARSSNAYLL